MYFLINRVGSKEIFHSLSLANPLFLAAGMAVYLILLFIRTLKWYLLIKATGLKIKYFDFLPLYLTNSLAGNITPFKSGEAATPFLLKKYIGLPIGQGFSVVILDRFCELATFALFFCFGIIYITKKVILDSSAALAFKISLIIIFLVIAAILIIILSKTTVIKIFSFFDKLKKIGLLGKLFDFIKKEFRGFYDSLALFKNKKAYGFIIPLTIFCWLLEFLSFYLVMRSVLAASFLEIAVSQLTAIAGALITFIPLGIGIGELSAVFCLGLFGYPVLTATGGMLLTRIFLTGTLLTSGILGTLWLKEKK